MFCTKCGSRNPDDAEFCYKCGKAIFVSHSEDWGEPGSRNQPIPVAQGDGPLELLNAPVLAVEQPANPQAGLTITQCLGILLFVLVIASVVGWFWSSKSKTPSLNLLVWEGYADPAFVRGFEEQYHCKVSASYMGSSDELVAKLRGGNTGNYDVISPSSDVATSIALAGLAAPLDLTKLPTYNQLSQQLTYLPLVRVKGRVFGVPFMWGSDPLIYDTTAFPQPPDSWSVFWETKYRGKISVWDDLSTVYMAAQVLGFDKPEPTQLYNLTDEQLEAVKKKLLELKPNVRKMWSSGGELTNLFQNHEVVAAMGWPLMTNQLRKANFPVGETIPKENTTGWIDHLMITAGSENKELAHQFLEYMLGAEVQKKVTDITGYTPANPEAAHYMTADEVKSLHMDDVDNYQRRLYFLQDVPRRAKYIEVWNEVKAAR